MYIVSLEYFSPFEEFLPKFTIVEISCHNWSKSNL